MRAVRVPDDDREPFFTPKTLAAYWSISERTVRDVLAKARLPSCKVKGQRRIFATDVDAYLEAHRDAPSPPRERRGPSGYENWNAEERAYAPILLGDPCSYCGASTEHIDHIVPRARGGEHAWSNLTSACRRCNSAKCARPLLTFLHEAHR